MLTLSHKQMAVNSSMAWSRHTHIITSKMRQFTKTHRAPVCAVYIPHSAHTPHIALFNAHTSYIRLLSSSSPKSHVMVGNYKKYANFGEFHDIYALSFINVNIFRFSLLLLFLLLELLLWTTNTQHKLGRLKGTFVFWSCLRQRCH